MSKCKHLIVLYLDEREITIGIAQFKSKLIVCRYKCKSCHRIFTLEAWAESEEGEASK